MPAYDRDQLSNWVACYLLCRTIGRTPSELLGVEQCCDSCVLDRERWEIVDGRFGKHYRCRKCHRFIGYPPRAKVEPRRTWDSTRGPSA